MYFPDRQSRWCDQHRFCSDIYAKKTPVAKPCLPRLTRFFDFKQNCKEKNMLNYNKNKLIKESKSDMENYVYCICKSRCFTR